MRLRIFRSPRLVWSLASLSADSLIRSIRSAMRRGEGGGSCCGAVSTPPVASPLPPGGGATIIRSSGAGAAAAARSSSMTSDCLVEGRRCHSSVSISSLRRDPGRRDTRLIDDCAENEPRRSGYWRSIRLRCAPPGSLAMQGSLTPHRTPLHYKLPRRPPRWGRPRPQATPLPVRQYTRMRAGEHLP